MTKAKKQEANKAAGVREGTDSDITRERERCLSVVRARNARRAIGRDMKGRCKLLNEEENISDGRRSAAARVVSRWRATNTQH